MTSWKLRRPALAIRHAAMIIRPSGVLRQRPIGVGFVDELRPRQSRAWLADGRAAAGGGPASARGAARTAAIFERRRESRCFEPSPLRAADLQLEGVAQEVVGAGVFVEAADEVADGVGEIFLPAGRRVEQHVAGEFEEGAALVVGHAFEHFELHAVERVVLRWRAPGRRRA